VERRPEVFEQGKLFVSLWLMIPILLLAACDQFSQQSSALAALERKSGVIVYLGVDGNIYTINQGGGDLTAITDDAQIDPETFSETELRAYLLPTWSPDSKSLAFIGLDGAQDNPNKVTIHTAEADGSDLKELFDSEDRFPVYLYWSPESDQLSFYTVSQLGGLLQLLPGEGGESKILDAGQPFYWAWSTDGRRLIIHEGDESGNSRLSFLTPLDRVIEEELEFQPGLFQTPDWSPDGNQLLISALEEGESSLYLTDYLGASTKKLVTIEEGSVGFAWSPNGEQVAYIAGNRLESGNLLGNLSVIDLEEPDTPIFTSEEPTIAFYWSPDGSKIAYFVPTIVAPPEGASGTETEDTENQQVLFGLHILDVKKGESKRLNLFQPTAEFLNITQSFDQYQRSTTIWSPDSQNIVISAISPEGTPRIWIVHESGNLDPRPIAEGRIAFWSWD
jgi:TolB protein